MDIKVHIKAYYLEQNSLGFSTKSSFQRKRGTLPDLLLALCFADRLADFLGSVIVGGLYKEKVTKGGRSRLKIRNLNLVEFKAYGHSFVNSGGPKLFMMLVLRLLKDCLPILSNHHLVLFLTRIACSHLKSKYQIIIFMLWFINSLPVDF